MPSDEPKAHHYVQCAYLEGFCDPELQDGASAPQLRIYSPNRPPRTQIPRECAVQNYFYCVDQDGKRNFIVEKTIADMETASAPVLNAARRGRLPATITDRLTLAGYIALSIIRTPTAKKIVDQAYVDTRVDQLRALIDTPGRLEAYLDEEAQRTGVRRDPDEERRKLKGGQIRAVQTSHGGSLLLMFQQLPVFQERIVNLHWTILRSDALFLTCDQPVTLHSPDRKRTRLQAGQIDPDFIFPVSSKFCLVGSSLPMDHYAELDREYTRVFNVALIRRADRFVYSPFHASYIQGELDKAHAHKMATMKSDVIQL
jgi:Protein of unknown function (DUF4238)